MKMAVGLVLTFSLLFSEVAYCQQYLGNLSSNPYHQNSTSNPYGAGRPYNAKSVNNPYGRYGSPYSNQSATNPYSNQCSKAIR